MLLLPLLHQHQAAVHADFFPDATHGHEHHSDHNPHDLGDLGVSVDSSHPAFSQIDLLSLHIGQSFQFSSVFKKSPLAFAQASPDRSMLPHFQRGAFHHQHVPQRQTLRFSPPSLHAPPFFDRTDLVNTAIGTVKTALGAALVLVMIVLIVFLGYMRGAITVTAILPLSILFTFIPMYLGGVTANLMSLGGLRKS